MQSDGDMNLEKSLLKQALYLTLPYSIFINHLDKDVNGVFKKHVGNTKWIGISGMLQYEI